MARQVYIQFDMTPLIGMLILTGCVVAGCALGFALCWAQDGDSQ